MSKIILCGKCNLMKEHHAYGLCKNCYQKEWRNKNSEYVKHYDNEWYKKNQKQKIEKTRKWQKENPNRVRINCRSYINSSKGRSWIKQYKQKHRELIKNINKKCRIKYPEKEIARDKSKKIPLQNKLCEDCNEVRAAHKHHEDYNKPLEVIFLCTKCHGKRHWNEDIVRCVL